LQGIYDIHIQLAGVPLLPWEPPPLTHNIYASEVMSHPVFTLRTVENVGHIVELLKVVSYNGFPVVDPPLADDVSKVKFKTVNYSNKCYFLIRPALFLTHLRRCSMSSPSILLYHSSFHHSQPSLSYSASHSQFFFRSTSFSPSFHIYVHHSSSHMIFISPYHMSILKRFPFTFSVIGATFRLPLIYSFFTLSIPVTPHIHLNILIFAACHFLSSFFFMPPTFWSKYCDRSYYRLMPCLSTLTASVGHTLLQILINDIYNKIPPKEKFQIPPRPRIESDKNKISYINDQLSPLG
jgi:hypothetical protein